MNEPWYSLSFFADEEEISDDLRIYFSSIYKQLLQILLKHSLFDNDAHTWDDGNFFLLFFFIKNIFSYTSSRRTF